MAPAGAHLSIAQLVEALLWKLEPDNVETECVPYQSASDVDKVVHALSSNLRSLHNSVAHINRLPFEILATIFRYSSRYIPDFRPDAGFGLYDHCPAFAVCRQWRHVAILFPDLWSDIYMTSVRGWGSIRTHLEYSRSALLRVFYTQSMDPYMACRLAKSVASQYHRIRELHIVAGQTACVGDYLWAALRDAGPAQKLASLTVALSEPTTATLPKLFSGKTPCLRKLALHRFTRWPGNTFNNLTHISLHNQPASERCTLAQFLDFIGSSPLLEELYLIQAGPNFDDSHLLRAYPTTSVSLTHLRVLEMGFREDSPPASVISTFLDCFKMPADVTMRIWGVDLLIGPEALPALFADHSLQCAIIRRVTSIVVGEAAAHSRTRLDSRMQVVAIENGATLRIRGNFEPWLIASFVRTKCTAALVESFTFAPYDCWGDFFYEGCYMLLEHLTSLVSLTVSWSGSACLRMLAGGSLCPKLKELCIDAPVGGSQAFSLYAWTLQLSKDRARRGQAIDKLSIWDSLENAAELRYACVDYVGQSVVLSTASRPSCGGVWPTAASSWPRGFIG